MSGYMHEPASSECPLVRADLNMWRTYKVPMLPLKRVVAVVLVVLGEDITDEHWTNMKSGDDELWNDIKKVMHLYAGNNSFYDRMREFDKNTLTEERMMKMEKLLSSEEMPSKMQICNSDQGAMHLQVWFSNMKAYWSDKKVV